MVCGAFCLAVILAALALVLTVRDAVERSLDDRLRSAAATAAAQISGGQVKAVSSTVSTQLVDLASGQVEAASTDLQGRPRISVLAPADAVYVEPLPVLGWDDARILVTDAVRPDGGRMLVYALVSGEEAQDSVALAKTAAAIGVPVLVAVLGVAVFFGVGRALRPVERIRSEVAGISAGNLSQRVQVPPGNDEVTLLARTMNSMLDRLQAAAVRQNRFVADVSHELHSPLASTRAELEIAQAHAASTDWSALTEELLNDNYRMSRVVRDLLFLARSDSGTIAPGAERLDLDEVVRDETRRIIVPPSILIDVTGVQPVEVAGSADDWARVVRNLLENAVRHASSLVRVEVVETLDAARLAISDDGPGIADTDKERIFDRFTRLDNSRSRATGGAGLGLAITREIVRAYGGTIEVERDDGGGARFVVELPIARS